MKMKENTPTAGLGPLTFLVTTPSSVPEEGMQFLGMTGFVTVLHQLAQQLTCPQSSKNGTLLQETVLALATYFCLHGNPALDVTVTSPLQPNIINHAAEKSGYAIEAAEERKYAEHEKNCSEQGFLFVPLAVESLGGLSVTLKKALKRIALLADSRNYQSQGHAIAFDRLAQSVSVVIVRGSATMLLARVP